MYVCEEWSILVCHCQMQREFHLLSCSNNHESATLQATIVFRLFGARACSLCMFISKKSCAVSCKMVEIDVFVRFAGGVIAATKKCILRNSTALCPSRPIRRRSATNPRRNGLYLSELHAETSLGETQHSKHSKFTSVQFAGQRYTSYLPQLSLDQHSRKKPKKQKKKKSKDKMKKKRKSKKEPSSKMANNPEKSESSKHKRKRTESESSGSSDDSFIGPKRQKFTSERTSCEQNGHLPSTASQNRFHQSKHKNDVSLADVVWKEKTS